MKKQFSILLATVIGLAAQASTIETIAVQSDTMGRDIPVSVILPDAYQEGAEQYPVLYLLHGAGDMHRKWIDKTVVEALADTYGIIMVCPDGGRTSWYFDSPIDPSYQDHKTIP